MTGRRIVIDGQTYLLARRRDVCSVWDDRARRHIVEACLDDLAGRSAARTLVESITGGIMLGTSDIAQELDRLLERGDIVAVRERGEVRLLDAPTISDLRDLPSDDPDPIAPVTNPTWIEVRVVGEAGLSAAGTEVRLRLPDGERRSVRLDEHATVYADEIQRQGNCSIELVGPVELNPAAPSAGTGSSAAQISIPAVDGGHVHLATGASHLVVVRRPVARIVELDDACFDTAGVVFRPEAAIVDGDGRGPTVSGLLGIGRALVAAQREPLRWWIVGHADTVGSDADNLALSQARATNVYLLLSGDARGWADHCDANHTIEDFQAAYRWVARWHGWDCDPGPIDGDFGDETRTARDHFRERYNAERNGSLPRGVKQSAADWLAIHDMYSLGLAEQTALEPEALADLRRGLPWVEPRAVGAGEAYPREAPDLDDFASLANRRVDIVAFSDAESRYLKSPADPARLYGETRVFRRIKLVPAPDDPRVGTLTWITIEVLHARDATPIVGRPVRLEVPSGGEVTRTTGADGRVTFVGLRAGELVSASVLSGVPIGETSSAPLDEMNDAEATPEHGQPESAEEPNEDETFESADDDDVAPPPAEPSPPEIDDSEELPDAMEVDDDDLGDD